MERHDPNEPERPAEPDRPDEQPTEPRAQEEPTGPASQPPPPPPPPPGPRRLYRSRTDRVLGGVCGGLGRYFRVDPIILRIAFVVLLVFGGVSLIVYLAALLFVPNEPEVPVAATGSGAGGGAAAAGGAGTPGAATSGATADPPPAPDRARTLAVVGFVVLLCVAWPIVLGGGLAVAALAVPILMLALAGLLVWWAVSGEGSGGDAADVARRSALGIVVLAALVAIFGAGAWAAGVGGGAVAAGIVIAAGVVLVIGAFFGRVRALILPALALALGVGVVSASGIDLSGGIGERHYAPTSRADLRDTYELGMGELVVDLREADLPPGDTPLDLTLGVGQAVLLVPRDVCVAATAGIGAGNVASFGRDNAGIDLDYEELPIAAAENSRVVVDAEVGLGEFRVQHGDFRGHRDPDGRFFEDGPPRSGEAGSVSGERSERAANAGCAETSTAAGAGG